MDFCFCTPVAPELWFVKPQASISFFLSASKDIFQLQKFPASNETEIIAKDFTGGSRCVFTGDNAAFNLRK